MDENGLRGVLREAVRETAAEVLQVVMELDRAAYLREHGGRKNGYYPGRLLTSFLTLYARRQVDVGEVAVALYAAGVLKRKAAMRIFELTKDFPKEEMYSLPDQIRKSSRSVCTNLAEAWRR